MQHNIRFCWYFFGPGLVCECAVEKHPTVPYHAKGLNMRNISNHSVKR